MGRTGVTWGRWRVWSEPQRSWSTSAANSVHRLPIYTANMKKLRVGVLFGGRSGAHEVSLLSAASVLNAIDKKKYEVVPIGITKEGRWVTAAHAERLLKGEKPVQPEPRHLRAGDPQTTSTAAVLAKGEGVVVQ